MSYFLLDQTIGNIAIFNHEKRVIDNSFEKELSKYENETQYYEIIRCIDKIPLFFEDHVERLVQSASEILVDIELLKKDVAYLIGEEKIVNGNIKIIFTENISLIFASKFYYPDKNEYLQGVKVGLFSWQRVAPNIKVVRADYKRAIATKLNEPGPFGKYFETLLINEQGEIAEGSRSNVFFVNGNNVYTAPDSDILIGITRKYVLKAIEMAGCNIVVSKVNVSDIKDKYDGAFLTGTSIFVLPIYSIEDIIISSSKNSKIKVIMHNFEKIVDNYMKSYI